MGLIENLTICSSTSSDFRTRLLKQTEKKDLQKIRSKINYMAEYEKPGIWPTIRIRNAIRYHPSHNIIMSIHIGLWNLTCTKFKSPSLASYKFYNAEGFRPNIAQA